MNEIKIEHLLPDGTPLVDLPEDTLVQPELPAEPESPYIFADLQQRYVSMAIDGMFLIFIAWGISELKNFTDEGVHTYLNAAFFLTLIAYEPVCISSNCTIGQYLSKIRVRKSNDTEERIGLFASLLRYPCKLLLGGISFLTITSNPKRQAIHDMLAGSVVISLEALKRSKE